MANEWSWLTIPLFIEFVIDRKISLNCQCGKKWPADGNLTFNAYDEDDGFIPFVSSYPMSEHGSVMTSKSRHIACVRTTCQWCGTVDHYSAYVIKRWLDTKAGKPGTENSDG